MLNRLFTLALFMTLSVIIVGQNMSRDRAAIQEILDLQVVAWNAGNIDQFMEGYWKSDSLQFIGAELTTGWNATLNRYKKTYPDKDAMGVLRFDILNFNLIADDACLVTGKYFLRRKNDNPQGVFTLLFKRIGGKWAIVYDHTHKLD